MATACGVSVPPGMTSVGPGLVGTVITCPARMGNSDSCELIDRCPRFPPLLAVSSEAVFADAGRHAARIFSCASSLS